MGNLASLKQKMEERLKEAEAKVAMLRESLRMINEEMGEVTDQPAGGRIPTPPSDSLIASPPRMASGESLAQKIKDYILDIKVEFNNRGVALAILRSFPDLPQGFSEKKMLNKVSNLVWKLKKEGYIEVTHKGVGSEPNTFRVVRPNEEKTEGEPVAADSPS